MLVCFMGGTCLAAGRALRGSAIAPLLRSGGFDKLNHRHFATALQAASTIPTALHKE